MKQGLWRLLDEKNRKSAEIVCNYMVNAQAELAAAQHPCQALFSIKIVYNYGHGKFNSHISLTETSCSGFLP
jgi:hypothetical protein